MSNPIANQTPACNCPQCTCGPNCQCVEICACKPASDTAAPPSAA